MLEAVLSAPDLVLHAALEARGHAAVEKDAGELIGAPCGVAVKTDLGAIAGSDVLIDFTRPEGTAAHLSACRTHGVKMVIGTTGWQARADDLQGRLTKRTEELEQERRLAPLPPNVIGGR